MPLSPIEGFLYLMTMFVFATWPILLLVLIVAALRKRFLRALVWILLTIPVAGLLLEMVLQFGEAHEHAKHQKRAAILNTYFGDRQQTATHEGAFVGTVDRGRYMFRRFHFHNVLHEPQHNTIELVVPPGTVNSAASLSESLGDASELEPASLIIVGIGGGMMQDPGGDPLSYFKTHYPGLPTTVPPEDILLLTLYDPPNNGSLWYATRDDAAASYKWHRTEVLIDYDSLGRTQQNGMALSTITK